MLKQFTTAEGTSITIEIDEKGKVTYSVGKKKTTFDLDDCDAITYEYSGGENENTVITKDMLAATEELEPWMWLVINKGENRLEYNNNQTETRRHYSYSDQNDKWDTLQTGGDLSEKVSSAFELKDAISKLEPKQQELIKDIYFRGLSMAEVAKRDGVSKTAISNRMNRAIKRLEKDLKNF